MKQYSPKTPTDPRIRRTRRLLQSALSSLLEDQPFDGISITDLCKQADVARITFYQHYENKEALLLACAADFFADLYQTVDQEALHQYFETGEIDAFIAAQQIGLSDPKQVRLVAVALQYVGSAVRQLTIQSFLQTYSQHETKFDEKELEVMATFYVGGVLTLLEQFLKGQLHISQAEFQITTFTLLHVLRQGAIQSGIMRDLL